VFSILNQTWKQLWKQQNVLQYQKLRQVFSLLSLAMTKAHIIFAIRLVPSW